MPPVTPPPNASSEICSPVRPSKVLCIRFAPSSGNIGDRRTALILRSARTRSRSGEPHLPARVSKDGGGPHASRRVLRTLLSMRPIGERHYYELSARSLKRWIFPVAVFGSSVRNSIQRGYL